MSVYLAICGVIVPVQVICLAVFTMSVYAGHRAARRRGQPGDDVIAMLREWTDQEWAEFDAALEAEFPGDGEQHG